MEALRVPNKMYVIVIFILIFSLWYILKRIYENRMEEDPTVLRIKEMLLPTFPELNNVKLMKGSESATINKYRVYLCTEYNGVKYSDNTLVHVLLHELAHVLNPEIGHGDQFVRKFNALLLRARAAGLYDPELAIPKDYCGIRS